MSTVQQLPTGGWADSLARTDDVRFVAPGSVSALAPLKRALTDGARSCAIQVLGDSTGVTTVRWPYLLGAALAAKYPAYTVEWRTWDDTAQDYLAPTTIQTGTAGPMYLDATATTTHTRVMPGIQPTSGNIDVRVKCSLADWTPASAYAIATRAGAAPNFSWWLNVTATGGLAFVYSVDGTNLITTTATANMALVDGSTWWLRCVFLHDNGAAAREFRFYTSPDGTTWTQLGATVTTATAMALNNSGGAATQFEIGGRGTSLLNAKVYEVQIRDGENGTSMVPSRPDLWQTNALSGGQMPVVGAPVLTIQNGSMSGAGLALYLDDAVKLPKMAGYDHGQAVTFLSSSHNDGVQFGRTWWTNYSKWVTDVLAILPAPVIVLTQNPENGATNQEWHAQRHRDLLVWGRANSRTVIDTYQAFVDAVAAGTSLASLLNDTVHPNLAGQTIWANTILNAFNAA